jgi:hypothetical protein
MKKAESITAYAIRAEGLVEAMAHSGVMTTHLPTPAAQAMKFINGLDVEIESYLQLTAHCENSLSVFGVDVYPKTLPDALRFASKYKQMTASKVAQLETEKAATPPISTVLAARHETAGGKKKNGKADSGDTTSVPKTPAADEEDAHSWKKNIICRTCGVKGHLEKECPEKAAFQEFLAERKTRSAHLVYTRFDDADTDDFVPYYNA